MRIAGLLVLALLLQDKGEKYWDFTPGTQWTYDEYDGATKSSKTSVMRVTEKKDGKVYLESKTFKEGEKEPEKTEMLASYAKDGFVVWAMIEEDKLNDMFYLYKVGSKKGDKWKSPFFSGEMEAEIENAGSEKLKVAGKEYDAVHCTLKFGEGDRVMTMDYYIAEGVGLLKMESKVGETVSKFELKEFKAAK